MRGFEILHHGGNDFLLPGFALVRPETYRFCLVRGIACGRKKAKSHEENQDTENTFFHFVPLLFIPLVRSGSLAIPGLNKPLPYLCRKDACGSCPAKIPGP